MKKMKRKNKNNNRTEQKKRWRLRDMSIRKRKLNNWINRHVAFGQFFCFFQDESEHGTRVEFCENVTT
jgi:hypothetical protein